MVEIKTDENASKVSNQDLKDDVSGVASKACDMEKSRWSICNPMATT